MKRLIIILLLLCLLSVTATATTYIPVNEVSENRDGRQLIIKTYTLLPGDDTEPLFEDSFEREGFMYSFVSIVQNEKPFESKKPHSETVTVETASNDLALILNALDASISYNDSGYNGILMLDHTTLRTEATAYSSKSYTVSETEVYEGLDRNDPSYVPKTTIKDGRTLTLSSIDWAVQGTDVSGDSLVPTQYTATATYTATASSRKANGYITTAVYSGEIVASGIASIEYIVTFAGEPLEMPLLPESPEQAFSVWRLLGAGIVLLLVTGAAAYILFRSNTRIYTLTENGDEYEPVGRRRVHARRMTIDLTSFKKYPETQAVIELNHRTARRLFGRLVRVRLRDGVETHRIERCGKDNYWFTISTTEVTE